MNDRTDDAIATVLKSEYAPTADDIHGLEVEVARVGGERRQGPINSRLVAFAATVAFVAVAVVLGPNFLGNIIPQGPGASGIPTTSDPVVVPPTSTPGDAYMLISRVYSGPITNGEARTVAGNPDVIVWSDGVVVGRPTGENEYLSLVLGTTSLDAFRATLASAELDATHIDPAAVNRCFDGFTTIFTIDTGVGGHREVVAPCLFSVEGLSTPDPAIYGDGLLSVEAALNELQTSLDRVGARWTGSVPTVPVAPQVGG